MDDPEADALSLINTMLTETLYSRILGSAREHGLVYSMSSGFGQSKDSSNWWFGAQVMPKNAPKLFDIIVRELDMVFKGDILPEDVEGAKQYALGRYQRSGQTVGGTAAGYSGRYFFDDTIDDYYQVPQRLAAVTKDRIVDISRAMFEDKIWGMGSLGSCGEEFIADLHRHVDPLWSS
jgi:predicted Zn-dependent peptidase